MIGHRHPARPGAAVTATVTVTAESTTPTPAVLSLAVPFLATLDLNRPAGPAAADHDVRSARGRRGRHESRQAQAWRLKILEQQAAVPATHRQFTNSSVTRT